MRFINCPNCLSSHPDELERRSTVTQPLNHTKRSRLHSLTKAIFSPVRTSTSSSSLSSTTSKSKEFGRHHQPTTQSIVIDDNKLNHLFKNETISIEQSVFLPKYRIERKHKIKKRDLVKQLQQTDESKGNFLSILFYFLRMYLQYPLEN